jgi:2-C-methyl-D-erythritol 4-phosphate cytidylyltransferase
VNDAGLILAAAGRGTRLGSKDEEALVPVLGRTLLAWTLLAFDDFHEIVERIVLVPPGRKEIFKERVLDPLGLEREVMLVDGGEERQDSVAIGLEALTGRTQWVLVHDAARPLVTAGLIRRVLEILHDGEAVVPALPPRDSIARVGFESWIKDYEDRSKLLSVQTPQGFSLRVLKYAYEQAARTDHRATDEASLVLRSNHPVSWMEGEAHNLKITYPEDLVVAEALLRSRQAS